MALLNLIALITLWRAGWWLYQPDGALWEHDYIAQWAAGHRVLTGKAAMVYDWAGHSAYQAQLLGIHHPVELYLLYPPPFLFTTVFFAWLPFLPAAFAFLFVTVAAYAASLRLFVQSWLIATAIALAGGGAFYSLWWLQNGFLTAALLVAGLVWLKHRPVLAGIIFGLLTIKPQLGLLIPVALVFSRNWRAFVSAAGTSISLAVAAEIFLGADIWEAFFASLRRAANFLESGNLWFKQQSTFALVLPTVGPELAWVVQIIVGVTVAAVIASIWSRPGSHWTKSSALISGTLLATPYLYSYDAVPLSAAAALLVYDEDGDRLSPVQLYAVFACCLLPMATRGLFSAAVPLAALVMLYLAVRRSSRNSGSGIARSGLSEPS
jgi:hypothetical protein